MKRHSQDNPHTIMYIRLAIVPIDSTQSTYLNNNRLVDCGFVTLQTAAVEYCISSSGDMTAIELGATNSSSMWC